MLPGGASARARLPAVTLGRSSSSRGPHPRDAGPRAAPLLLAEPGGAERSPAARAAPSFLCTVD